MATLAMVHGLHPTLSVILSVRKCQDSCWDMRGILPPGQILSCIALESFQLTEKSHVTKTKSPHCHLYPRAVVEGVSNSVQGCDSD